jgi:hypothetical protein
VGILEAHLIELFHRQPQKLLFKVFVRGKGRPGLCDFSRVYRPPNADMLVSTSATRRSKKVT